MGNVVTFQSPIVTSGSIVTTAETIVATVQVTTALPGQRVVLHGLLIMDTGASVTSVRPVVRRGATITSPIVQDPGPIAAAASSRVDVAIDTVDLPGEYAGPYVLTVVQAAATGNGAIIVGSLAASVI